MNTAFLLALSVVASSGVEVVEEGDLTSGRVFVPAFRAGGGATPDQANTLANAVLESARRLYPDTGYVGAAELGEILDVEAQKQVAGCDADLSCLSELADALDAPELLSGDLSRLGETWILDLKRVDRGGVKVIAQVQLKRAGTGVDALLDAIDDGMRTLYGGAEAPGSPEPLAPITGGPGALPWISLGSGVVLGAAGAILFVAALDNADAVRSGDLDETTHEIRVREGVGLEVASYLGMGVGAVLVVAGGALFFIE